MTRDEAYEILCEYTQTDALRKHALSVEAVMAHFAKLYNEDETLWRIVGLLHDVDYEKWPDEHCKKAPELLRAKNADETIIRAVVSHGFGICSDVCPESDMEKVLYTIDELTGLITAAALMRPSKSVMDMELKSLKKKYKDKRFAAGVCREIIENGCEMLGMELDRVLEESILGMRESAEILGLEMHEVEQ